MGPPELLGEEVDLEARRELLAVPVEGPQVLLLANWDKPGEEQYLRAFYWDGKKLTPRFEIDFLAEELGRPHIMRFGQARGVAAPPPGAGP